MKQAVLGPTLNAWCIALSLGFALVTSSCVQATQPAVQTALNESTGPTLQLTPEEVKQRQQKGESFVIVDVRARDVYDTQHIEGAVNFPLAQLVERAAELPRDKWLLLYCTCPADAAAVAGTEALRSKLGFNRLAVLVGGMNAWLAADFPVVRPSPVARVP